MKQLKLLYYRLKIKHDNKTLQHSMSNNVEHSKNASKHWLRNLSICGGICIFLLCGQVLGQQITMHMRHTQRTQAINNIISLKNKNPLVEANVPKTKRRKNFANEFDQLDAELPNKDQILPSIVIAQAADESDWGNSPLYQEADNAFGVKGSYHGHSITLPTTEYVPVKAGKHKTHLREIKTNAKFKRYPSLRDSVLDHNRLLKHNYITSKSDNESYISIAEDLQKGKYATDPNYADNLMGYIQSNNLDRFD